MKYMDLLKIECEMQMSCSIYLNQVIQKIKDDKLIKTDKMGIDYFHKN